MSYMIDTRIPPASPGPPAVRRAWTRPIFCAVAFTLGGAAAPAGADMLVVRMGSSETPLTEDTPRREVRCVILEETVDAYRVRVSQGVLTYPKARVIRVERQDDDANTALAAAFADQAVARRTSKRRTKEYREADLAMAAESGHLEDSPCLARRCALAACLHLEEATHTARYDVENCLLSPLTVRLTLTDTRNVTPTVTLPLTTVIPPRTRRQLFFLRKNTTAHSWRFEPQWQWCFGDPAAEHDDTTRYRLPWRVGESYGLSQGVGGEFTHTGRSQYSFDFPMPVGTLLVAARGGTVIQIVDGYRDADASRIVFGPPANQLVILHADGTFAVYAHLNPNGIHVYEGQRVQAGEVIAESGNTGYSTGPHLHFAVGKATKSGRSQTVDIRFDDRSRSGFIPKAGRAYTAF